MTRLIPAMLVTLLLATTGHAQTPQPFPRPGAPAQPPPAVAAPATPPPPAPAAPSAMQSTPPAAVADPNVPSAATLGVAIYPTAQFLGSYDAGRAQRYYIFGSTASFTDIVGYYRTQLDDRGDLVYKDPGTHMFSGGALGRFREETMAFPPSVTVKDWTSGGSRGYPNPKLGAQPARFPTIIMIVPPPPAATAPR